MRSLAFAFLVAPLASCDAPARALPDRFTETGEIVALSGGEGGALNACVTCHGVRGEGDGAGVPRLAGLDQGYLLKQLRDYADGRRRDEVMAPIARALDDGDMLRVSAWYAGLPPATANQFQTSSTDTAHELYARGDPRRGLPACSTCHGADAGGAPGGPALAGQPRAYLADQLQRWRRSERRNDARNVMLGISRSLTEAEIQAVSAYLAGLPVEAPSSSPSSSSTGAMPGNTSSLSQK